MLIWKLYFWIMIVLLIITYRMVGFKNVFNYVDLIISGTAWVGFFTFAYGLTLLTPGFWKVILYVIVIWDIIYNLWILKMGKTVWDLIVTFITLIPLYYGLFLYAFKVLE